MTHDLLGNIGGIEFVTASKAFDEAVSAYEEGHFGKPADSGKANTDDSCHRARCEVAKDSRGVQGPT